MQLLRKVAACADKNVKNVFFNSAPIHLMMEGMGEVNKMAMRRPFDPAAHDLDANFRLTRFADLKG